MKKKERNFTFDLLYALAIIMVVDDHTKSQLGILKGIFPYDSFFMPLFVFVSVFLQKAKCYRKLKTQNQEDFYTIYDLEYCNAYNNNCN